MEFVNPDLYSNFYAIRKLSFDFVSDKYLNYPKLPYSNVILRIDLINLNMIFYNHSFYRDMNYKFNVAIFI